MQVVIVDQSAPESVHAHTATRVVAGATQTFNSVSFGTAATDRYVVVALSYVGSAGGTLSSATIGGVAATVLINRTLSSGGVLTGAAIIAVALPSGTSGTVVANFSASMLNCAIDAYAVTGWLGSSSVTGGDDTGTISISLTLPTNSTAIAVARAIDTVTTDPTASATWTGLTERSDEAFDAFGNDAFYHTSASGNFTAAQSPLSISCAHTSTDTAKRTGVAAGLYN